MDKNDGIDLYAATEKCFVRYLILLDELDVNPINRAADAPTDLSHLLWMCHECLKHIGCAGEDHRWTIDKYSRWLGFIQGVLAEKGFINVNEERDVTRPWFTGKT